MGQALDIQRRVLGEDHPALSATLGNLALLTAATNRLPDSLAFHLQAAAIDDRLIGEVFSVASERERMSYLATVKGQLDGFLSLLEQHAARLPERPGSGAGFGAAPQNDRGRGFGGPARFHLGRPLSTASATAAGANSVAGADGPENAGRPRPGRCRRPPRELAQWGAQKERLETHLTSQIPEMNLERQLRAADRRSVAAALPEASALVEFIRFQRL